MTTFDDFYKDYPRKEAKLDAIKAWEQVLKRGYDPDEIHQGLKSQLHILCERQRKYIKLPGSWLRAGCWMDELEEPVFLDRNKRPFATWTHDDRTKAQAFRKKVGDEAFLKSGYTQEHLDGLNTEFAFGDLRVVRNA